MLFILDIHIADLESLIWFLMVILLNFLLTLATATIFQIIMSWIGALIYSENLTHKSKNSRFIKYYFNDCENINQI